LWFEEGCCNILHVEDKYILTDKWMIPENTLREEFQEWADQIPFIQFPSHWQVQVIPTFLGAQARFLVKTETSRENEAVSVYLDCYGRLGHFQDNTPYWEVYACLDKNTEISVSEESDKCGPFRCGMNSIHELKDLIEQALKAIESKNTEFKEDL